MWSSIKALCFFSSILRFTTFYLLPLNCACSLSPSFHARSTSILRKQIMFLWLSLCKQSKQAGKMGIIIYGAFIGISNVPGTVPGLERQLQYWGQYNIGGKQWSVLEPPREAPYPARWARKASQSSVSKNKQVPRQGKRPGWRHSGWGENGRRPKEGGSRAESQRHGELIHFRKLQTDCSTWRKPTVARLLGYSGRLNERISLSLPTESSPKLQ